MSAEGTVNKPQIDKQVTEQTLVKHMSSSASAGFNLTLRVMLNAY